MRTKIYGLDSAKWGLRAVLLAAVGGSSLIGCGKGDAPTASSAITDANPGVIGQDEGGVDAAAKVNMRWILQDRCNDRRGLRVRLADLTDRRSKWPTVGSWKVGSNGSSTKSISCESRHPIGVSATQDPPGAVRWSGSTTCRPVRLTLRFQCRSGFAGGDEDILFSEEGLSE